jgi:D-alanyl-D-alanine carboxypeptidase
MSMTDFPESELAAAAQRAFDLCAGTPGLVVGVAKGADTWFGSYGHADSDTSMTPNTHLRIGSVTKSFTASILLQFVEAGTIGLDDRIATYLPDVDDGLTVRMLATMRSGIADYTADPALVAQIIADPTAPRTSAEVIAAGLAAPRLFAPDAQFAYSNTNYVILGSLLEQVSGTPFATLLGDRVLTPLGLAETWWPGDSSSMPDPFARGYTLVFPGATPETPVDTTGFNPAWAGTAGALVSTAKDMLIFARALGTGALLSAETHAMRIASLAEAPALGPGVDYGIGLMRISGWIGHSGHIPGYRAACYYHPHSDVAVVVLTAGDIVAGNCPDGFASASIPTDAACMSPTARVFDAVSQALGHPSTTPTA